MTWQRRYRWIRSWPGERGLDGKPLEDYCAYDGEQYAGRIRLDRETLKKDQWNWAGAYPKKLYGSPIVPNAGWLPTAAEAAKKVEDYWDAMKALVEERKREMPAYLEEYKGYRITIYSPNDHYAVVTPPGSNAIMDFGDRQPRAKATEGLQVCLDRAKALIDERF